MPKIQIKEQNTENVWQFVANINDQRTSKGWRIIQRVVKLKHLSCSEPDDRGTVTHRYQRILEIFPETVYQIYVQGSRTAYFAPARVKQIFCTKNQILVSVSWLYKTESNRLVERNHLDIIPVESIDQVYK